MEATSIPEPLSRLDADRVVGKHLRIIAEAEKDIAHNEAVRDQRKREADDWCERQNYTLRRVIDLRRERIAEIAMSYDFGDKKSRELPEGTFGWKKAQPKYEVADEDALLGWCESETPESIKTERKVPAKVWKTYIKHTGEVPPGIEAIDMTPGEEAFGSLVVRPNMEAVDEAG